MHCGCKVIDACRVQLSLLCGSIFRCSIFVTCKGKLSKADQATKKFTLREARNLLNSTAFTCAQRPSNEGSRPNN